MYEGGLIMMVIGSVMRGGCMKDEIGRYYELEVYNMIGL